MSAEMINNHKKVVFLDVDGTMVNDRGEIPESTKEAVRRAKANGHKKFITHILMRSTGRAFTIIWRATDSCFAIRRTTVWC